MASLIENAETPRHIYMMLTKSYRFAFLKYAMPYFSQKDFSEYLANAWVMCESPNNDPNFTQKQMLGLFKKADPQVLMDEDEYRNQAASHGGAYPEDKTNMSEYDYLTAGGEPEMRRG